MFLAELGDYCPDEHKQGYISQIKLIPNQTNDFEQKVSELHRLHKGQNPADAEYNYLEQAKRLDMYGIELHKAKVTYNIYLLIIIFLIFITP